MTYIPTLFAGFICNYSKDELFSISWESLIIAIVVSLITINFIVYKSYKSINKTFNKSYPMAILGVALYVFVLVSSIFALWLGLYNISIIGELGMCDEFPSLTR